MVEDTDILQVIPDEELPQLRDFYQGLPHAPYLYSFINTSIRWKKQKPEINYVTFYAPHGKWQDHGTFIAHIQFGCNDILPYTKEESSEILYECLTKTNRFDFSGWSKFFFVHRLHDKCIKKVIQTKKIKIQGEHPSHIFFMPKEEAIQLKIEIPPDVFIRRMTLEEVPFVNSIWPHRYKTSEIYLKTTVEMNGAYCLCTKKDNSIAAWILKINVGTLGVLHVLEEHKRKGYGSSLIKYMSREIAQDGHHPLATVIFQNKASISLFTKLGFKNIDWANFVECDGCSF